MSQANTPLSHGDFLQLKCWNTPTIYNGWEQITKHDRTRDAINLEEVRDFMPQMGPMVGYAMTVTIQYQPFRDEMGRGHPFCWNDRIKKPPDASYAARAFFPSPWSKGVTGSIRTQQMPPRK